MQGSCPPSDKLLDLENVKLKSPLQKEHLTIERRTWRFLTIPQGTCR